ncbi:hypothetical protein BGX38DRAFT_824376 [Terfezia claveryi]|nr:hypothetical protein BGX38DRAFT_824376 [Terfezia claveryi]
MADPQNLLIPVKLDAFVFNKEVCNGQAKEAKIAPISQPNYTFLRVEDYMAQGDILDHVDIHNSTPPTANSRLYDLGNATLRENRLGVYLHWLVPRPYRGGTASTDSFRDQEKAASAKGIKATPQDHSAPTFPPAPNRWLIIRKIDPKATTTVPQNAPIEPIMAWVVEGDRMQNIDDIPANFDLQVDFSPFIKTLVNHEAGGENMSIQEQAEVFIGYRHDASTWEEGQKNGNFPIVRVELTVTSSSNQLFPDFQYHCANVFSMLDTFEYYEGGTTKHLQATVASYYVLGWHAEPENDLLSVKKGSPEILRKDRLNALNMELNLFENQDVPADITKWLDSPDGARVLCHGAMYDVEWDAREKKKPPKIPANDCCQKLNSDKDTPVAVGTTTMDALLAYVGVHRTSGSVEDDIWQLQTLLRADDDGVDAQIQAADEIQSNNFAHFGGGTHYFYPNNDPENKIKPPTAVESADLLRLNSAQRLVNSIARRAQQLQWELFACWWKYISDIDNENSATRDEYSRQVADIIEKLQALQRTVSQYLQKRLEQLKGTLKTAPQAGVLEDFHQRQDPTIFIAGVSSGWPWDFQNKLKVRLDNQTITSDLKDLDKSFCVDRLPSALKTSGELLVREFLTLFSETVFKKHPIPRFFPLYHDGQKQNRTPGKDVLWRDRWGSTQAWFPLFIEWEAEYTHIPYENWALIERDARLPPPDKKHTLGLITDVREKFNKDTRIASGRNLILPQPKLALSAHIDRIFSTVPKDQLDQLLPLPQREHLKDNLDNLTFLSCPLHGLTQHLTTEFVGTHVKPLVRVPGLKPIPLVAAEETGNKIGLNREKLALIDKNSDPTPYGSNPSLLGTRIPAFKPVTHGQLRFRKINVVDKFGQTIYAIDPEVKLGTPPIYPWVSEFYAYQTAPNSNLPNVVDPSRSDKPDLCEFVQLPPSINQPARLNAHFVIRGKDIGKNDQLWVPATDWQNPIWGWVVMNYVDRGVQLFLPDGTFYREVRLTEGIANTSKWLPFQPAKNLEKGAIDWRMGQLDKLLLKLMENDQVYLRAFVDMVETALEDVAPPPASYAQFANALVGRPLALVHVGWSLELSTKPKVTQSTLGNQKGLDLPIGLLPGPGVKTVYSFPIKFGDKSRRTDGLIGYFRTLGKESQTDGNALDLTKIFTYFGKSDADQGNPIKPIDRTTYPKFEAFWLDLNGEDKGYLKLDDAGYESFELDHNNKLQVFGALIDPFLPINAYTSILPIRSIKLPTWTWETALRNMTAFFHIGPLIVTQDVPAFDSNYQLRGQYDLDRLVPGEKIAMPALKTAEWAWLQPYDKDRYMPLDIGTLDQRPRLEKGPYTAVEGYLQMKQTMANDPKP